MAYDNNMQNMNAPASTTPQPMGVNSISQEVNAAQRDL